jgi:hypothetical protein
MSDQAQTENSAGVIILDSSVCKLCGKKFSSFTEMQHHMTIDHMQKGDISNTMTNNSS